MVFASRATRVPVWVASSRRPCHRCGNVARPWKVCRQLVGDTAKALRKELLICGMMTQNGVTHTAISKAAEKYRVAILTDCCTTVRRGKRGDLSAEVTAGRSQSPHGVCWAAPRSGGLKSHWRPGEGRHIQRRG